MEILWFTLTAIVLYVVADRALDYLERRRGKRFENRSVIFFVIILTLALGSFQLIQYLGRGAG